MLPHLADAQGMDLGGAGTSAKAYHYTRGLTFRLPPSALLTADR